MENNVYPGKLIVFEGLDGSGQTTQVELLKDFLTKKDYQVISTKEPTLDSQAGIKIKEILDEKARVAPRQLQKLFTQDRKEHLEKLIIPALKSGKTVISDRYFFSSFAYGTSDELELEKLIEMNNDFLLPDLTFILKTSPEICIQRIEKRGQGIKLFEKREKLAKVWKTYEILPNRFKNIYIINGEKTIEQVFSQVKEICSKNLLWQRF